MQNAHIWKWSINRSKALVFIVYTLLALLYVSGLYQKLYISADDRIKFHAIPVAISTLYQGHKHDYRGWRSTEIPFQHGDLLTDKFIAKQIKAPVDKAQGHYYWVADDRGYGDYVIAAFALFGPHMKSLYHFWFIILLVSITLFTVSFGRHVWAMAFLALGVLGMHSSVALLKLMHVAVPIYEPRYLDVLALISVFHMIFAAVFFKKEDLKKGIYPLLGQLFIFIFLYHARSSLGWEIVAIMGISLAVLLTRKEWNQIKVPLTIIVLMLSGVMVLVGYKHLTYHKSYFDAMGARTFWHNALMGYIRFRSNQAENTVGDLEAAEFVIQHAKDSGACAQCIEKLDAQELLNTLGNWGKADWVAYEKCAKNLYFSTLLQNKWEGMRLYFYKKPLQLLADLSSPKVRLFFGESRSQSLKHAMPWNPFNLLFLLPLGVIVFFSAQSLFLYRWQLLGITLSVFITGMIPSVAFYSDILTHGGLSATMVVLVHLGLAICALGTYKWLSKLINAQRVKAHET